MSTDTPEIPLGEFIKSASAAADKAARTSMLVPHGESAIRELEQQLAAVKRERDEAVADNATLASLLSQAWPLVHHRGTSAALSLADEMRDAAGQPHPGAALLAERDGLKIDYSAVVGKLTIERNAGDEARSERDQTAELLENTLKDLINSNATLAAVRRHVDERRAELIRIRDKTDSPELRDRTRVRLEENSDLATVLGEGGAALLEQVKRLKRMERICRAAFNSVESEWISLHECPRKDDLAKLLVEMHELQL